MTVDFVPALLMALAALLTAVGGVALSRRGAKDTHEQQQAANQLQTRVNTVDELEAVITHLRQEREYAEVLVDKLRAQNSRDAEAQAARCQAQLDRLIDNVATLQSIVTDEIARAAAQGSVRDAQGHEQTDHGRTWDPNEIRY